ncbi:MAG TPA: hypothetical protein VES88_12315 [Gemmatimonadaceae bacterium]|nr:hypothetical protein [Gemmatimonadaceae bacterium]
MKAIATPIDFDSLVKKGVLKKKSARRYAILDMQRVPEYARKQITAIEVPSDKPKPAIASFMSNKRAQKLYPEMTGKSFESTPDLG